MAMLEVKNLEVYYGVIQAIKGISFEVNEGEVIALIGANGAGKTTTLATITGMIKPAAGEILFEGTDISKIPGHKIVSMGMAHVPEGRRVFAELSVYENLKLGAYTRKNKAEIAESLERVYKSFPRLEERKNQLAGTLSGGEQQRVILARALTQQTECLVLDEPTNHLDIKYQLQIMDIVKSLDLTVVAAIHDLNIAAMYCDRLIAIKNGEVYGIGTPQELLTEAFIYDMYEVDSRVRIDPETGRMNIIYLPQHWCNM